MVDVQIYITLVLVLSKYSNLLGRIPQNINEMIEYNPTGQIVLTFRYMKNI